jgi:hypothetical protein
MWHDQPFVAMPEQDAQVKRWVERLVTHGEADATLPDLVDDETVSAFDTNVRLLGAELLTIN